jgi:nucleotide-binding universal stress UspA family protein
VYKRILVPVENSGYDGAVLDHVRDLAKILGSTVVIIHVADGFAARNISQLDLRESEEMQSDRAYIELLATSLEAEGLDADAVLASGDPAHEITQTAAREGCDLIAMATHGHKFIEDVIRGSVANSVRHNTMIPVLLVRGKPEGKS